MKVDGPKFRNWTVIVDPLYYLLDGWPGFAIFLYVLVVVVRLELEMTLEMNISPRLTRAGWIRSITGMCFPGFVHIKD